MSTLFQIKKKKKKKQCLVKALKKNPQKKGICLKVLIHTPKKPCSAKRKVMRVRFLSINKSIFAYIPGEGVQTLRTYSRVLIRGGSRPDLPGVHYIIIRGKWDLRPIDYRRQGRSKYGGKLFYLPRKKDRWLAFSFLTKKKKKEFFELQKYDLVNKNFFFFKNQLNFQFFTLKKRKEYTTKRNVYFNLIHSDLNKVTLITKNSLAWNKYIQIKKKKKIIFSKLVHYNTFNNINQITLFGISSKQPFFNLKFKKLQLKILKEKMI